MAKASPVTPHQREEERSLIFALTADVLIMFVFLLVGLVGGSLTILAESIRIVLMIAIEFFAFAILRRVHRGTLPELEYGTGKLEQIANLVIGLGMLGGSVWIFYKAMDMIEERTELRLDARDEPHGLCGLETRERFPRRSSGRLKPGLPIPPPAVRTLRDVERHADQRSFELVPEHRTPPAQHPDERPHPPHQLQSNRVNPE